MYPARNLLMEQRIERAVETVNREGKQLVTTLGVNLDQLPPAATHGHKAIEVIVKDIITDGLRAVRTSPNQGPGRSVPKP
jgi:hypothetical protein